MIARARVLTPAAAFGVAALGIGLFSVMDALMKSLVLAIGVWNAMFWRTLIATGLGCLAWRASGAARPAGRALRLHLLRGAVTAVMALLFFWGLARMPMAQAITLTYIAPLLALVLAAAVLGERVGRRVVAASLVAFSGVMLVLVGQARDALGPEALHGALAVLASAVLYAVNLVIARVQAQAASPGEITFFQSGVVCAIIALGSPWLAALPPAGEWWKLASAAILATASLWLLAWAYAHSATGFLATTEYTSFVYAAAFGWLIFGEPLSAFTLAGAAVIVGACLASARTRDVAQAAVVATA